MKLIILGIISSFLTCSSGFVVPATLFSSARSVSVLFAYELVPEIDGGEELVAISTSPVSRMKNLGEVAGKTSKDGKVFKFWMTAVGEGALIKDYRATLLKDASKKANFPGFRKGQVPPYAMPQITGFAIQEALIKSVEATVAAYGLKSLAGSDGEVQILEDLQQMCKGYNAGDSLPFTATLDCAFGNARVATVPVIDSVIDVEVEQV